VQNRAVSTSAEDRSNWVQRPPLDLLSDGNLAAVRGAFRHPRAVVFGWQYRYFGGGSRSTVAFTSTEEYFRHIERAKPGDHFTLFELDALLDRAVIHIGNVHSTHFLDLDGSTPVTIAGAHRSLHDVLTDEDAEVLVIRRFAGLLTGTIDVTLSELPGTGDEREVTFKRDLLWGRGELVMFDQRLFDEDEYGGIVETVTPVERRRIHALVDAKRPSLEGTVPLSGAY
jgi:hypothetical protein